MFSFTDLSSAKRGKSPTFAFPVTFPFMTEKPMATFSEPVVFSAKLYKDGGSTEYYGLGYKVIKYVEFNAEQEPHIIKVDFGTWFMKFSYPK